MKYICSVMKLLAIKENRIGNNNSGLVNEKS